MTPTVSKLAGAEGHADASLPNWAVWTGRVLSAVPVLMMFLSGAMKISRNPHVIESFVDKFGFPPSALVPIGLLEIACAVIYLIPRTAVLGAVLVASYFGGAVATHVRMSDPSAFAPVMLGIFAWGGLYLRDARVRELLPLVRRPRA